MTEQEERNMRRTLLIIMGFMLLLMGGVIKGCGG